MSRRVRYGALLGVLSFGFLAQAAMVRSPIALAILAWAALATQAVAIAYLVDEPALFGKRSDGSLPAVRVALLLPYLLVAWTIRDLLPVFRPEDPWHDVGDRIFLGRYVKRASALPPDVKRVVDLTCEMSRIPGLGPDVEYIAVPALDGTVPPPDRLRALVEQLAAAPGALYVHCAAGHGRSAVVAAALLVARGIVAGPDEAVARLRATRPLVGMNLDQLQALERVCSARRG